MTKTKQLRVTLYQVLSWGTCYTKAQLVKLAGKRKSITALQILRLPIPDKDKLWAVLREELIPAKTLHRFACDCAWSALMAERKAGREPDERSWNAVRAKRRWIAGKCGDNDLSAARSAAAVAAAAAWSAARPSRRAGRLGGVMAPPLHWLWLTPLRLNERQPEISKYYAGTKNQPRRDLRCLCFRVGRAKAGTM